MDHGLYQRRKWIDRFGSVFAFFALVSSLFILSWILYTLFIKGILGLNWKVFTEDIPVPDAEGGGLRNAIVGSFYVVFTTLVFSTPIGVMAGIYLAEYGQKNWFGKTTSFVTDVMLSAPSIVIGLFIWMVAVKPFSGWQSFSGVESFLQSLGLDITLQGALLLPWVPSFSGWAGSLALSMLAIPVIVRTTENMMKLVPGSLREAAFALGTPEWRVYMMVCLKSVRAGVLTGILLALARVTGETAPLLFTAGSNQFFSTDMNGPLATLPVVIFQFANAPYNNLNQLAWAGAFLVTLFVLLLNILARVFSGKKQ